MDGPIFQNPSNGVELMIHFETRKLFFDLLKIKIKSFIGLNKASSRLYPKTFETASLGLF